MKTERLYAITVYLLNHGRTSARRLADYFEVSPRTIQRDMDSLNLAGIPITAYAGAEGGYEIAEQFRLDHQLATSDDYACILTALRGLVSATDDPKAKGALEKISRVSTSAGSGIVLDFSVLREAGADLLPRLQSAVLERRVVRFTYTNNDNETRVHQVEPVAVIYRWYAWYLLAYSTVKSDYRFYKLVRMQDVALTDQPFGREHEPADAILEKTDRVDSRRYRSILVKCKKSARSRASEYLSGTVIEEAPGGGALMELRVVENEQLWIGTLLSLGEQVEIVSPEDIRRRVREAAEKIVAMYK